MESSLLCPLCCNTHFGSKQLLIEHLLNVIENITCPICCCKQSSVDKLVQHLKTCQNLASEKTNGIIEIECSSVDVTEKVNIVANVNDPVVNSTECHTPQIYLSEHSTNHKSPKNIDTSKTNNMYLTLENNVLMKSTYQTQELKVVQQPGGQYVIITGDEFSIKDVETVVTKQNTDGTISLTTVVDGAIECDASPASQPVTDHKEVEDDLYTCNTCGISFTSVLDHIQNFHNNQDVVVEGVADEVPMEMSDHASHISVDESNSDTQTVHRYITEAGNIVEEPVITSENSEISAVSNNAVVTSPKVIKQIIEVPVRNPTKKYLQVDKFCESVVQSINKDEKKSENNYHPKIVIKEMKTLEGEETIKVYNCLICKKYVSSVKEFLHFPCKQVNFCCPHCFVIYDNGRSLAAHMKVHKPTPLKVQKLFKCEVCATVFNTNKSLKLHKRMHDPIKARTLEPPFANEEGKEVNQDHFLCKICDKLIPTDYRTIHQDSHLDIDQFNCNICNRKFTSKDYLEMHLNIHNNEEKPQANASDQSLQYKCGFCSRRFGKPHEKVKHERIHTGEKPHSCDICGKTFRVSYCLTLHMRTHTGARPYECHRCGKRFKAHSVYNHHMLTHSDVRGYKCPFCPKAFKTSVQLSGHKNSHTKPFSCQLCNRPFASLYAVRIHTETHYRQNSLQFACSSCGASYARSFALKDHMKNCQGTKQADIKEDSKVTEKAPEKLPEAPPSPTTAAEFE